MSPRFPLSPGVRGLLLAAIFISGAGFSLRAQESSAVIYDGGGTQAAVHPSYPSGTRVMHRVRTIVYPDGRIRRIVDPTPVRIIPPPQQVQARAREIVHTEPRITSQRPTRNLGAVITDRNGTRILVEPNSRESSESDGAQAQESDPTTPAPAKTYHVLRFDAQGHFIPDPDSATSQASDRNRNPNEADEDRDLSDQSTADYTSARSHAGDSSATATQSSAYASSTPFRTDSAAYSSPAKKDVNLTPHPGVKNYPTATRSSKYGFVKSPYAPYNELDATGLSTGSLARDPSTGKIFKMP